jgi:hypothetical protein
MAYNFGPPGSHGFSVDFSRQWRSPLLSIELVSNPVGFEKISIKKQKNDL